MTALYFWAVVAATNGGYQKNYEWRYMGEFMSIQACHTAAKNLTLANYRCIVVGDGSVK